MTAAKQIEAEVPAMPEAPVMPAVTPKPFSISVSAPVNVALDEAVVHARDGYVFSDGLIQINNGFAFFVMVQGNPKAHVIKTAEESIERSKREEAAQRKRDIEEAAKRMLEEQKRAELEKQVADATKALEKQIAELRKAADKELAKLN